jgi:hypothetical protein
MPKRKPTVDEWVKDYPELKYENKKLFCQPCMKMVSQFLFFKIL